MNLSPRPDRASRRAAAPGGFTLAEIAITVAIAASVLVALFGLLPTGLQQAREASALTVGSQILQEVVSEVQLSGWAVDANYVPQSDNIFINVDEQGGYFLLYYNQEGQRLPGAGHQDRVFTARVSLSRDGAVLPGAMAHLKNDVRNPFVRRLSVDVTDVPGVGLEFFERDDDGRRHPRIRTFATSIASLDPVKFD